MASIRPFLMNFYHGGNIGYENGAIKREKSTSTFSIPARHRMLFEEFVDLIYTHVGVDKKRFKLKISLQFEHCGKPNSSPIMSDATLDSVFFLAEKDESFSAQIHVAMVEIQRPIFKRMLRMY